MRILHTSDWHLGRTLHGRSRSPEHEAMIDELVGLADDAHAGLVVISGDVFESTNPPIDAEELFFDALARLGDGGRRAVVVIAGNHDSPDRLKASGPLCDRHGVWIFGRPGEVPRPRAMSNGVTLLRGGPSLLDLGLPGGDRVVVGAVPYPSESRLATVLSPSLDDRERQAAYERALADLFAELARAFDPAAVSVLTSHLAVTSCMPSPSERALIGGAWQVSGAVFPASAQYVALGHLHLAQAVPDAPTLARYAGSPLAMRFVERDFARAHVVVDAAPGRAASVELVPVRAGRPLVVWEAGSVEEVERGVEDGLHPSAFVDLRLSLRSALNHGELLRIKRLPRDFVRIRVELPEAEITPLVDPARRRDLPLSELFVAFYRHQTGNEPAEALTSLLVELAGSKVDEAAWSDDERAAG